MTYLEELRKREGRLQSELSDIRQQIKVEETSPEARILEIIRSEGYTAEKISKRSDGFFIHLKSNRRERDLTTITGRIFDELGVRLDGVREDDVYNYRTWWVNTK